MNERNSDFRRRCSLPSGFQSGRRLTGGAPNVTQWMRLKQPVRMDSSDGQWAVSMWLYSRLATAPPAEWPVIKREHDVREGFSSRRNRRRAAMGRSMARATRMKPSCTRLPGSSRKPAGLTGVVDMFVLQSRGERREVPRMAKMMRPASSIGTDLTTIAFVPSLTSAFM